MKMALVATLVEACGSYSHDDGKSTPAHGTTSPYIILSLIAPANEANVAVEAIEAIEAL